MKSFLKTVIIGVVSIFGSFLLGGFLHKKLHFSTDATIIIVVLAPFALVFLLHSISEATSESNDLLSFLVHLLGNVTVGIMAVVLVIGGLYSFAKIALCIGALILGLSFAAHLRGIGNSKEREIERLKDEIKDLESERDSIPT